MMTDKKLTDNEIKKALEYEIEIAKAVGDNMAYTVEMSVLTNALDLINRQKAEIKEYEKVVGKLGRKDGKVICVLKGKETEYIPTDIASVYRKLAISKAKAEAYKECIEKAKESIKNLEYNARTTRKTVKVEELKEQMEWVLHTVVIETLNNLLKELEAKNNV